MKSVLCFRNYKQLVVKKGKKSFYNVLLFVLVFFKSCSLSFMVKYMVSLSQWWESLVGDSIISAGGPSFVEAKKYNTCKAQNKLFFLISDGDFLFVCTLLNTHLPPLRLHCVGGCWDRTQDCCDFGISSQTLTSAIREHRTCMRGGGKGRGIFIVGWQFFVFLKHRPFLYWCCDITVDSTTPATWNVACTERWISKQLQHIMLMFHNCSRYKAGLLQRVV